MSVRLPRRRPAFALRLLAVALLATLASPARADLLFVRDADVAASQPFVDELADKLSGGHLQKQVSVVSQDVAAGYQRLRGDALAATDDDDQSAFESRPRTRSLGAPPAPPAPTGDEHRALQPAAAAQAIVVAVGPAALRAVLQKPSREPVVAVLVSRSDVDEVRAAAGTALYAIVTNQPARRQLALLKIALPAQHRVGVVYPPDAEPLLAEFAAEARRADIELIARRSDSATDLSAALAEVLPQSDLLLLLADPVSLGAGVAQSVLRSAAAARKPVIASTEAMVRAGALLGVYTTRSQFIAEAADAITRLQQGGRPPAIASPSRFSVGVNASVAHALSLDLPDEAQLQQGLGAPP